MKLTTLIITLAIMQVSAIGLAQNITLRQQQMPLSKVLKEIRRQTSYNVLWSATKIGTARPVDVNLKNASITDALNQVLSEQPFTYEIDDRNIIIKEKINLPVSAQPEGTPVTGKITDEQNAPIAGAVVKIKDSSLASVTNEKGEFSITASPADSLQFSFIGYKTEARLVGNNKTFNISLSPSTQGLNEVVVVGYGTQKRANLTGAVASVKMDDLLGNRPVSTTGNLLQGAIPGLEVGIGNGEPGLAVSLNVRGATDINPNGGNAIGKQGPLILVDNVPLNSDLNLLDPNDIESVTMLKDAGSAAIYGARSAFGVMLITTKKGTKNQKVTFNYSNNITISTPTELPQKATVLQTIQSYKDMGTTGYWSGQDVDTWLDLAKKYTANPALYPNGFAMVNGLRYQLATTDAFKNVLGENAFQMLNNLSVSGGSDKTTYRISLGTANDNGVIVPTSHQDYYKRYNVRSVVTSDVTNWLNLQLDAAYYNSNKSYPLSDGFSAAAGLAPYSPLADTLTYNGVTSTARTPRNAVTQNTPTVTRFDDARLTGRAVLKPFSGLVVTGEYAYDNLRSLATRYDKINVTQDIRTFNPAGSSGTGEFRKTNALTDYHAINIFANYSKSFKKHHFGLLAGFNQEDSYYEQEWIQSSLPINNELPSISQSTGILTGDDNYSEYSIRGFFGRLNYDYDGKYLLEINGRNDASSKFPENHRSGFFPSFSAGWVISKENFMKGTSSWLSELKLRGSFGSVGNQSIDPYQFVPGLTSRYANWLNDSKQVITLNPPDLVSSNFTWATVQTADLGIDLGFLNNRLTSSFDIYQRDTKNMLYTGIQLPLVLGTTAPLQNVAALRAKGFELQINWRDKIGNVGYRFGVNLYDAVSKITKIQNKAGLLSQYYVGQTLGEMYGYVTDRLYTADDFVAGTLSNTLINGTLKPGIPKIEGASPNPGDVLYKDLNHDGVINAGTSTLTNLGDRKIIGNNSLRYQYGITGGVSYKNFDFSFVAVGVGKQDQFRVNALSFPNEYAFGTIYAYQLNYWTPKNMDAFYGRTYDQAKGNQANNERVQTRYLLNGAYLKIKNLSLAYSLPKALVNKLHISKFQVFASVENAFTFDHLPKGSDPTINPSGDYGYDYPFMRLYSFGANLSF